MIVSIELWQFFFIFFVLTLATSVAFFFIEHFIQINHEIESINFTYNNNGQEGTINDKKYADDDRKEVVEEQEPPTIINVINSGPSDDEEQDSLKIRLLLYFISLAASFATYCYASHIALYYYYHVLEYDETFDLLTVLFISSHILLCLAILFAHCQQHLQRSRVKSIVIEFLLLIVLMALNFIFYKFTSSKLFFVAKTILWFMSQILCCRILLFIAMRFHKCSQKVLTNLALCIYMGRFLSIVIQY